MSRLAILVVTLSSLPWSGESFVSTIASTTTTTSKPNLPSCHTANGCCQRSTRVGRSTTRRQLQQQQEPYQPFSFSTASTSTSYRRSSSLLKAALLTDPDSSGHGKRSGRGRNCNDDTVKKAGWHRRILGKIPWRRAQKMTPLRMIDIDEQGNEPQTATMKSSVMYQHAHQNGDSDFVARNFNTLVPESVLPVVQIDQEKKKASLISSSSTSSSIEADSQVHRSSKPPSIDSEYFDVSIRPAISTTIGTTTTGITTEDTTSTTTSTNKSNTKNKGLVCRLLENILNERIGNRWSTESPEGLTVDVRPSLGKYNNIGRLLFKGHLRADATLASGRLIFPMIRFSSVRLEMERVTLNLMGFFNSNNNDNNNDNNNPHQRQQQQRPLEEHQQRGRQSNNALASSSQSTTTTTGKVRYPKQFDLHIEDLTMSRHDLLFSPCIKNGLRQLLVNVLKDRGLRSNSIRITSIDILVSVYTDTHVAHR